MKIRNKILITICSLILLSLIGQIIFNQFLSKSFFLYQQERIISDAFEQIKETYDESLINVTKVAEELQDTYNIKIFIYENEELVYASNYAVIRQGLKPNKNKWFNSIDFTETPRVNRIGGRNISGEMERLQLSGTFRHNGQEVSVLLIVPISSIDNSVAVFTEANIYISVLLMVIGIVIAFVISKKITEPITNIEIVSKRIAAMDFSCLADENVPIYEMAGLAKSVNQMSQQLENSMHELTAANEKLQKDIDYKNQMETLRREFIASVSHEMKTPLALLQIYADNLKNNVQGINKDYYCDTIVEETEKLNRMVSEMLESSSISSGFIELNLERMNFSEFCQEITYQYQPILEKYHSKIDIADDIFVLGDAKYLERVLKNLLNNAVQHTKYGDEIQILVNRIENKVTVEIYNQGGRIKKEDLEHIWDAFYQTDKSRVRNINNNVGLGLYIVKTVMDKHNGDCGAYNHKEGVIVYISLDTI